MYRLLSTTDIPLHNCAPVKMGLPTFQERRLIDDVMSYNLITTLCLKDKSGPCFSRSGKLFHIDFGYILGRDPKPMPPPMKLSKEMIEAFGGMTSDHYHQFR